MNYKISDKLSWFKTNWRWIGVIAFFSLIVLVLIARLYSLQISKGEYYRDLSERQYSGTSSDYFDREDIYFTDKNGNKLAAATLQTGYKLAINPNLIKDVDYIYGELSNILEIDKEKFYKSAKKEDDSYEEIEKQIPQDIADKILDLNIQGITLHKERWRYYPGDSLASQVIGFLSFQEDDLVARYGLERQYDNVLEKRDQKHFTNFFAELFSTIESKVKNENTERGSISITIEPTVQSFVEDEILKLKNDYTAKQTGAIVMNPKNGEIYSMAMNPDFDLNNFSQVDSSAVFNNSLVENIYEMGSIIKPLTVAIGLDKKVIRASDTYNDTGSVTLNNATFYNYDLRARGVVEMQDVLNQSLNTGVYHIVSKLGNKEFADYMKKLIGGKTGIDLPNEVNSLITNLDSTRDIEYATASFGQGIAMNAVSITRALAALGNGGLLVQPHLLKETQYNLGIKKEFKPVEPVRIFSEETSEEISRMLVRVVDEALRGGTVALPNHTIAAKTGTAQIANQETGGYYKDRYLHSFFGYFPAYDPEFIVFLYVVEPNGVNYASETLTEPFMNITKFLINYYDIPPDR